MKGKILILLLATCLILFTKGLYGGEVQVLERDEIRVLFEPPLGAASKEVANVYQGIRGEIEGIFGWSLNFRPTVLLITIKAIEHGGGEGIDPCSHILQINDKDIYHLKHMRERFSLIGIEAKDGYP